METRIKEPVFIRTFRLKFDLLNLLNKKPPEAETRRGSYITGIMCSEFLKFEEFLHSHQNSSVVQKAA